MSVPTDRKSFRTYCLRKLGAPVITLNLDEDQIQDRIDEALDFWRQFNYDAAEKIYYKYQVTPTDITNGYIPIPDTINAVNNIFPVNQNLFSTNMFSYNYQFALNDLPSLTGGSLQYYETTMEYLSVIEQILIGTPSVRFNRHTGRLSIDMAWGTDVIAGQFLIVESNQILDEDDYPGIWSDRMLQKYCVALLKQQWGANLRKYTGVQLPGGITLNGEQIFEEASADIVSLQQEMETTYQEPPSFFVG